MKNNVDPFQTDHSSLAEVITKLREEEGLTKQALAQKIGCLESTIEKFENGETFSLILLYQICNGLNVSFMDVLKTSTYKQNEKRHTKNESQNKFTIAFFMSQLCFCYTADFRAGYSR
ncbi:MAG: helix-turn-helix transcriptional regulator [Cyanobacteria bacterium TGS_CYA1]|nr:helix-turn-helix transcriptional regulator [Cyanobacteria bacterium TGS_CYA1]